MIHLWLTQSLIIAVAATSAPALAEDLHLVCIGGGSANKATSTYGQVRDNQGNAAWGSVQGTRSEGFADQVNIDIVAGVGRIKMPRSTLPPLHGGDKGWMEIENLKVAENEITGSAAVNFINSPKIRIDRVTGVISINGKAGQFSAQCQPYDPATVKRAF